MDGSFTSRYISNPNMANYQSTPMTRKAQTYQYVNGHQRSPSVEFKSTNGHQRTPSVEFKTSYVNGGGHHRSPSVEFKTPTSSIHTSGGEEVIFENMSTSKRSSNSGCQGEKAPSPANKLAEMDANTILRQRKELQVMIAELKGRCAVK